VLLGGGAWVSSLRQIGQVPGQQARSAWSSRTITKGVRLAPWLAGRFARGVWGHRPVLGGERLRGQPLRVCSAPPGGPVEGHSWRARSARPPSHAPPAAQRRPGAFAQLDRPAGGVPATSPARRSAPPSAHRAPRPR